MFKGCKWLEDEYILCTVVELLCTNESLTRLIQPGGFVL